MIHTENTPNPDSLKFLSEKTISSVGTEEFQKKDKNKIDNLFIKNLQSFKKDITIKKSNKILKKLVDSKSKTKSIHGFY